MTNLMINTNFAVSKAKDSVIGWEQAVVAATEAKDEAGIMFCQKSLEAARARLEAVRADVKSNWTAYL